MKVQNSLLTVCLFLFSIPANLWGANLYIFFDSNCMDRLEYSYIGSDRGEKFITYNINVNANEKVILEIGIESRSYQNYMPAEFINCENAIFDKKLVQAINSNIDKVFVILKKGVKKYSISPVTFAAYFKHSKEGIQYASPKYTFDFDFKKGVIGEDIAYNDPRAEIYFEGKLENDCSGAFLFRQFSEYKGNPHTDLVLVPEIGIIEERSGRNVSDAFDNALRLEKVNGKKLDDYLRRLCKGIAASDEIIPEDIPEEAFQRTEYDGVRSGNILLSDTSYPDFNEPYPRGEYGARTEEGESTKYHLVKKGNTLYGISRQYGPSIGQLRAWNNLGSSNLIRRGSMLRVASPGGAAESATSFSGTKGSAAAETASKSPYVLTPRDANIPAWKTTDGIHIVQRGETVAAIAMKYGYSEARFRDINGLAKGDYVKVRQKLKTTDCSKGREPNSSDYYYDNSRVLPEFTPKSPGSSSTIKPLDQDSQFDVDYRLDDNSRASENKYTPAPYSETQSRIFSNTSLSRSGDRFQKSYGPSFQPEIGNTPEFYETAVPKGYETALPYSPLQSYDQLTPRSLTYPQSYDRQAPGSRTTHVVQEGETLYSIANRYDTSVQKLRSLNRLESGEILIPYQRIYVQ